MISIKYSDLIIIIVIIIIILFAKIEKELGTLIHALRIYMIVIKNKRHLTGGMELSNQ